MVSSEGAAAHCTYGRVRDGRRRVESRPAGPPAAPPNGPQMVWSGRGGQDKVKLFRPPAGASQSGVATLQCRAAELEQALAALSTSRRSSAPACRPSLDIDRGRPHGDPAVPRGAGDAVLPPPASCARPAGLYCGTGESVGPGGAAVLRCLADFPGLCGGGAPRLRGHPPGQRRVTVKERSPGSPATSRPCRCRMEIDHRDTLACILFDGPVGVRVLFMEALYDSGRFPCLFVGGSAGGKFDFRNTWLHDGTPASEPRPDRLPEGRPGHPLRRAEEPELRARRAPAFPGAPTPPSSSAT